MMPNFNTPTTHGYSSFEPPITRQEHLAELHPHPDVDDLVDDIDWFIENETLDTSQRKTLSDCYKVFQHL